MISQTAHSKYRSDIDGLRAVAVIPVCLFHAGLPMFPGGFVGVDVFFVISGYLMASVISSGLSDKTFSFVDFYERRIRRIFPAFYVVVAFTSCTAVILMSPKLLRDFGSVLLASVFFVSNVALWRQSANYFEAPVELNPLLHTWSLSVEEQFYIFFPLFLALAWRFGRRVSFFFIAGATILSFLLSVWGVANAPTATFYLLPTRAWELLIGSVVAMWPFAEPAHLRHELRASRMGNVGGLLGLSMILCSVFLFNRESSFPGATAILPCLGTASLLYFGRNGGTAARLLAFEPLTFVGRISYSLYLWHWPLLVFVEKYDLFGPPSLFLKGMAVLISFVAAYASYLWVEQPFRQRSVAPSKIGLYAAAAVSMAIFGAVGVLAKRSNGWPERFPGIASVSIEPQLAADTNNDTHQTDRRCFIDDFAGWGKDLCFLSSHSQDKALLWGDSFAASYAYGLSVSKAAPFDTLQYTSAQCPPIVGFQAASRPTCGFLNQEIPAIIRQYHISTVIMAANWEVYLKRRKIRPEDIRATIDLLHRCHVRVVLIGQSPVFGFVYPDEYFFKLYGSRRDDRPYEGKLAIDPTFNDKLAAISNADIFFNALAPLCDGDECVFRDRGLYLFSDYGHFTHAGSVIMVNSLLARMSTAPTNNQSWNGHEGR